MRWLTMTKGWHICGILAKRIINWRWNALQFLIENILFELIQDNGQVYIEAAFYIFTNNITLWQIENCLRKTTSKYVIREKFETRIAKLRYQRTHKMQSSDSRTTNKQWVIITMFIPCGGLHVCSQPIVWQRRY